MTKDEKVIKEIIVRYGDTLNLKKTPYVITEIIRQFGRRLGGGLQMDCQPPGGPPRLVDPSEIIKDLQAKATEMAKLSISLQKAIGNNKGNKGGQKPVRRKRRA
ncbi:MAG: hypothetical protein JSR20_18310 [Nitrospira sp.]|nr:hypothetical protein [Nitrospira sp.]